MPLYKTIQVNPTTQILLWKITEPYAQLLSEVELKEKTALRLDGMKSEQHRRGFLSVRKLLQQAGYNDFDLHYDEFGKPYFNDGKHISISHSHEFAAIIISDKITGIDLEMCRDKITNIADKFLNETEYAFMYKNDPDYIQKLTVLWGIKEVVFKIRNEIGISFKDHVRAAAFEMQHKTTTGYLEMNGISLTFPIYFEKIENFILVYAFGE